MSPRQRQLLPPDPVPLENSVQADIRLALGKHAPHTRLFRNARGEAWLGKVVAQTSDTVVLARPMRVGFGLAPHSGDLLGATTVTITPDMVGQQVAVFTSLEVKRPSIAKLPAEQENWAARVRSWGGIAGMVRSPDEALQLVNERRRG